MNNIYATKVRDLGINILHLSDTHKKHHSVILPDERIDIAIYSGDATTTKIPGINVNEWASFIQWYEKVDAKHKIFVAGNHDATASEYRLYFKDSIKEAGVIYLENDHAVVEGLTIFGSPYTPTYGDWYFMRPRHKMASIWENIPLETDILVTHGPRKGILDSAYRQGSFTECVGDAALGSAIDKLPYLKLHCFGHIHDNKLAKNNGIMMTNGVIYSNASAVKDRDFDNPSVNNQGNLIYL